MSENNNNKGGLYFVIGALLVAVLGLGYFVITGQSTDEPDFSIDVDDDGVDIDTN